MKVKVEFSGGLELLFSKTKEFSIDLGEGSATTLKDLISLLKNEYLKERPELFVQGDNVRPGILVLVNDTDSDLLGHLEYIVEANDTITFISTLHGG